LSSQLSFANQTIISMVKSKRSKRVRGRVASKDAFGSTAATVVSPMVVPPPRSASELKYYADVATASFTGISSSVSSMPLFAKLITGVGLNQRIGFSVTPRRFTLDGTVSGGQSNLATDDSTNTFRICVVVGAPGVTPSGITVSSLLDPRSTVGVDAVLADRIFTLQSPGRDSTGYMPAVRRFSISIPLSSVGPILYSSGAVSSVKNRDVFLCMVSDSALAPHPGFVNGAYRFDYFDS